jgi:demethylmenaquinone methyltransferase/2-methoxy-6-polyprenyl-1,4-benzoquinol methylase
VYPENYKKEEDLGISRRLDYSKQFKKRRGIRIGVVMAKQNEIISIFDSIAQGYDYMNSLMTIGLDKHWRRLAVKKAEVKRGSTCLDLCCGTSKLTRELARSAGPEGRVVGVDLSREMLAKAADNLRNFKFRANIKLIRADAADLPFADNFFDCAVIGWGLRNIADISSALEEMIRVVKPGGKLVSIDMGKPHPVIMTVFRPYVRYFLPFVGGLVTNNSQAFKYFASSIETFLSPKELSGLFQGLGLIEVRYRNYAAGIISLIEGRKP